MTYEFYKEIGLTIFLACLAAVFLGAGIAWLAHDMNRHAANIQTVLAEIKSRKDSERELTLLRGQAAQASGQVPYLTSILPDEDALISVPREAASLARLRGLDFSFVFGASMRGATTTAGTIAYTISGKGPLDKWVDFFDAFERASPLASVEKITLTGTDSPRGETGGKIYEANAYGNVFSQ